MSIRTKVVLVLVVCTSLASATVGALSYRSTQRSLTAELDASLDGAVRLLARDLERRGPVALGRNLTALGDVEFQVVSPDGQARSRPGVDGIPATGVDAEVAATERSGVQVFRSTEMDEDAATSAASNDEDPLAGGADLTPGEPIRLLTQSIGRSRGAIQAARSLEETERVLATLRSRILAVSLLVAGGSALAGWVIARQLTGRLVSVTDAAEEVASTGALDVGVPVAGSDEAARLGTAFNSMMTALSRSRADQQRLVQDAGHELRTPMTSLRTNLHNLRRFESMDEAGRAQVLDDLRSETEELSLLIDEVVEVATDRRGDEPLTEVDLGELAGRVAGRASTRWGRPVSVSADDDTVLQGRREALTRAVRNLVENAAKFDPSGAGIELVVRNEPAGSPPGRAEPATGLDGRQGGGHDGSHAQGGVSIEVLDRGPGIPEPDLPYVFERFHRSDAARAAPGSGLGLAIVAEVVDAHGGTYWARNRDGGGAAVGFRLPVDSTQQA